MELLLLPLVIFLFLGLRRAAQGCLFLVGVLMLVLLVLVVLGFGLIQELAPVV